MTTANEALAADRAFLWHLERQSPGLHIAGLARIEGGIERDDVLQQVERLRGLPRFGLRVETSPLGAPPRWRSAPFEPERHVHVAAGSDPAAALHGALEKPLDPKRPLWEAHVLPAYHDGGDALLLKAHLAAVDGLGTNDLFEVLFDSVAARSDENPPEAEANGRGGKDTGKKDTGRSRAASGRRVAEWVENWAGAGQDLVEGAAQLASEEVLTALLTLNEVMPDAALPPLPLPFNRPVAGHRRLIRSELSYADIRTIRSRLGGALSDVVLAVVGGALDRYLVTRGISTAGRSLRIALAADVPDRGRKRRSMLPVDVPLNVDAAQRLRAVHQLTRLLRAAHVPDVLASLVRVQGVAGPLAAVASAMTSRVRPPFHLTVANATGPQIPMFLAGRPVMSYTPSWPVGIGQGLSCAFFAYNQLLHVGITVNERACPNGAVLPELLAESLGELREAAGSAPRPPIRDAPFPPSSHADQTLEI